MAVCYNGNDVMRLLDNIPCGQCPNFYLSGASVSSREKLGMRIAEKLEESERIPFKGAVREFTILMPYYNDTKGAERFLLHLKNSVSIAQDCYDAFRGLVLIELDQEWGKNGYNHSLVSLFDYIRRNTEICFLLLFPSMEHNARNREFFNEISCCGSWIRVASERLTPHQSVTLFRNLAERKGYQLTDSAEGALLKTLQQRNEDYLDNADAVQQLFRQIVLERDLSESRECRIDTPDVMCISGTTVGRKKGKIGFAVDIC